MRFLVTGAAGFIGHAVCSKLLAAGDSVIGVDILTDYYDVALKQARLARLTRHREFADFRTDICDLAAMQTVFDEHQPERIVHLAAQAGVRHSLTHPASYVQANLVGFSNILELARNNACEHLVFASTSSVYGANTGVPFSEDQNTDHPLTLYAATKKANEVMAHSYAHLFRLPCTGLRFFTVYGPWGRPDMALFKFVKGILEGSPVDIYNHGKMHRDFTYVADLVRAIRLLMDVRPVRPGDGSEVPEGDSLSPAAPYRVVNIGNSDKVRLLDFVEAIEDEVGRKAVRNYLPMQAGDVPATWADASLLQSLTGYRPQTPVKTGITHFVAWYRAYYRQ